MSSGAQSASGMSPLSFKMQKRPIFKVFNLKKTNFNGLSLLFLVFLHLDLNLRKNEKIDLIVFGKVEIFWKNVISGPIFHDLCLIRYKIS